jgi:hypothetical protein
MVRRTDTDGKGRRYSLDVNADSSSDAAQAVPDAWADKPVLRLPDSHNGNAV